MIVKDLNESTTINPNGYKVKKFKELLNVDIHKSLKECTTEFEGYKISFNYLGYNDIQNVIEDGTLLTKLLTRVSVESKNSDYKMSSIINLLNVPVENNVGITFRGRNIQSLAEYKSADGWSIATEKKDDTSDINEKVAIEMRPTLHYKAQMGKNFEFACKDDMISVKSGSRYVSLLQFLRVLTGKSKQDLLLLLGNNRIINKTINSDKHGKKENTFEEDINIIYELFSDKRNYKKNATKSSTFKLESIRERFLAKTKMKINGASRVRLAQLISFTNRAEGKVLGEDITVNGVVHRAGEILTTETLKEIDESNITRLIIDYNNKLYDLRKYKCEQDRLTPEEFFTVLNIYACTLDGFDIKGSLYDLTNRVEVSYTDIIQRTVLENVNSITFAIKSIISKSIDEETFDNSLCMWFLNKRGDTTQPNKLLTKIAENKQGTQQASDFVNTAALIAKDNKASADMKNATDEVTKIQDNQRNRTDPVDSPESSKIGLVHTLAFHTIKDENGFLVTPYLKVENGKVASDKLYYLSALDEEHKYVASWDVDMESDNIHDKVTAYYDGTLVEVERTEVDYMEYSCLQAASFVRNLVPFPNFSNPKRLLMSANHHKQTIPTIRNERPLTDTGVSCLSNMGIITAKTILDNYFETHSERLFKEYGSKEEFLKCKIELISTQILSESRIYMFKAYGKDGSTESIEVMEHFMKKTDKSSIYTTNINKQEDFMYQGDDVVLFTSDMDINGAEIVKCVNYGKFTVEDKLFQYSMALGKNFLIGYRTTDSSNIDDAICINEDLIYDQSLSSVYAKEVKVELEDNSKYEEHLGFMNKNNMNDKIESSGLPKQGAVFAPGDMLIAKTRVSKTTGDITNQDSKPVNYYLDNNTSGCVTHAEPVEIRDNTTNSIRRYVVVGLAEISPIEPGDKLAGRCGNKGVVSKAVPSHEMPYIIETGEVLQITLNPLGIPSRMNIGQLLECYLSMGMYRAYQQTGKRHVAIVSPFHPDSLKFVKEQARKYDVKPMMLRDGATGEDLKRPVNVGMMYMLKQEHIVSKKIHAISICEDPQSMNLQPKRGKKLNGGQKFGEMETWALLANNCPHILQMFMSVQSDDLPELKRMQDSILGVSYIDKQGVEHKREGNAYDVSVQSATNRNADVMQALARCLGMELTNGEPFVTGEGKPEINDPYYVPLTDEMIGNLDYAPSDISEESLHPLDAPNVRRRLTYEERKVESRRDWKYFNLETKIISPFWILDNQSTSVAKLMTVRVAKGEDYVITALSSKTLIKVLKKQAGFIFTNDSENSCNNIEYVDKGLNTENGVEGIVKLFKTLKVKDCMKAFCDRLNSDAANDSIKDLAAKNYAALKRMLDSGIEFSDYVISKFPILPENYRPSIKKSTAGNDLDIHYKTIFEAIKTYKITKSSDSRRKIFLTIAEFQGYTIDLDSNKFSIQEDVKIPGIAQVFLKKDSNSKKHNMLRETVLSKVMNYSGRSVIIPTQNLDMRIDQIGLPFLIAHKIWEDHIVSILSKPNSPLIKCGLVEASKIVAEQDNLRKLITAAVTNNQYNFRDMFPANSITLEEASELMFKTRQFIIKFLETRMCVFGRQPTLHKHGMRAYHVLIVESKAIQLHPLVCKGYNADFDGDQMYVIGMIDNESIREAKENLTPMYHVVNVKDGSLVLEHTQDMLLGNYFATMLYDNKLTLDDERYTFTNAQGEKELIVYSFRDLEELRMSIESSIIELQDICSVMHKDRKYISTAGRILFNSMFDDSFTKEPFDNPLKIANINNGEFYRLKYDGLVAKKGGRDGYISLPKITTSLYTDTVSGEKENLVDKLSNDQLNEFINSCKEEQILTQEESDKLYATDLSTKVIDRTRFDLSLEILKGANRLNISSELKSLCTDLVNEDVNGAIGKFFETEEVKSNLGSIKQNLISLCRLGASSVVLLEKVIDGSREPSILRSLEANIKLDFFRIIVATVVGQFANNGEYSKEFYLLLNAHMTESDILSVIGAVSTLYGLDDIQLENLQYNFKLAKSEALRKRIKQYLVSTEFNNYKKAIDNLAKVSIKYRKLDLNNDYGSLLDRIVTHEQMEILEIIDFIKVEEIEFLIREFSSLDNVTKLRVLGEYEYDEENYKLKLRSDLEKRISYMEFVLEQQERQGEEFFNKILHSFRLEKVQSVYQAISVFGFRMSSLSGITLTLEDFERDTKVDDIADNCKEKIRQIDEFYKLGMITTKERNELVIAQGNKAAGDAKDLIKKTMDRNNNLFIISDSGSRGSDDQIAQSVGIIGVSMKTLTEAMETPILSAYATGLTPQEMNIASYGARAGVVSTQNSTPDSGYAARKTVMMLSGFKIVEEDCGKEVRPFKVKYGLPTMIKYKENGVIKTEESDSSDSIRKLSAVLGHKKLAISTSDNVIPELEGDKYNEQAKLYLKHFLNKDNIIDTDCAEQIFKHHMKRIYIQEGEDIIPYEIRYALDTTQKSLFINRLCYEDVPGLKRVGEDKYITEETIKWINKENPDTLKVRLLLDCHSKGGCCSKCYGVEFDRNRLPKPGEPISIESAQAFGEPIAQMVMSLFHKGGRAGTSVSSGVDVINSFIDGIVPRQDTQQVLAGATGYIQKIDIGNRSIVNIIPTDVDCNINHYYFEEGERLTNPVEIVSELLTVKNGEYIKVNQSMSLGMLDTSKYIVPVPEDAETELGRKYELWRKIEVIEQRQYDLVNSYYKVFEANGIDIYARHLEILSRLQSNAVTVTRVPMVAPIGHNKDIETSVCADGTTNYSTVKVADITDDSGVVHKDVVLNDYDAVSLGEVYELQEFTDLIQTGDNLADSIYSEYVDINYKYLGKLEVVSRYSGILAAATFERNRQVMMMSAVSQEKSIGSSMINDIASGRNIETGEGVLCHVPGSNLDKAIKSAKDADKIRADRFKEFENIIAETEELPTLTVAESFNNIPPISHNTLDIQEKDIPMDSFDKGEIDIDFDEPFSEDFNLDFELTSTEPSEPLVQGKDNPRPDDGNENDLMKAF